MIQDAQDIVDVVNGVAIYADQREWAKLRGLYADEVAIDYTSFVGGEPSRVRADDLMAGWKTGLKRYTGTQHLLGNHRVTVEGDHATCLVYVQATHWLAQPDTDDATWTAHGYYDYRLERSENRWKITHHTFTATIVYGNRHLLEMQGVAERWTHPSMGQDE
jgi:hypothetical protein